MIVNFNYVLCESLKCACHDFDFALRASWLPQGESMTASLLLPESNTSRDMLLALNRDAKLTNRDGTIMESWKVVT